MSPLALLVVCLSLATPGCSSLLSEGSATAAGVAGTADAASVTKNAAVSAGIGLGVLAAAQAGVKAVERNYHGNQQDLIAEKAGELAPGQVATWQSKQAIRLEPDEAGRVTVSRVISASELVQGDRLLGRSRRRQDAPERVLRRHHLQRRTQVALGHCRAGHGALGQPAMRASTGLWPSAAALAAALAGCSSVGGFVGAVAGIATGTFTTNPVVGVAVGVTVKAATDAEMNRVFREMQSDEQDRIAAIAAGLQVGDRQSWQVHHLFSYGDQTGEVQVLADIDNALATCKEVLFSVLGGKRDAPTREWFVTQTRRQSDGRWRWAAAEPATARWARCNSASTIRK